jgi:hypothetical protein
MRRIILLAAGLAAAVVLLPATASADSATQTFVLEMEGPNTGVAANGDEITITGMAAFSVNPKSLQSGSGTFMHTKADGSLVASGTWTATDLVDYQSYGCGVVFGDPLPPPPGVVALCGGRVAMRVLLTPSGTSLQIPATLTVICVIGPNPPNSIFGPRTEGAILDVPGSINFNHSTGGDNVFVQTS